MAEQYAVTAGAGSLVLDEGLVMEHAWTAAGVTVVAPFTGAHLLHLAVAGCVLNDLYREAHALGLDLLGVRVSAGGSFEDDTWHSAGVGYDVSLDCDAEPGRIEELLARVDEVAEIPRSLRHGVPVKRVHGG